MPNLNFLQLFILELVAGTGQMDRHTASIAYEPHYGEAARHNSFNILSCELLAAL